MTNDFHIISDSHKPGLAMKSVTVFYKENPHDMFGFICSEISPPLFLSTMSCH